MNLYPLPAFSDNYIWLLHHQGLALVVDPGDASPVTAWLKANQLQLDGILVTHHHGDHTGGVSQLLADWHVKVYGPAQEALPFNYQAMKQGDTFEWQGLVFQTLDVPGHTAGHIAYWTEVPQQDPLLFCGDTLFRVVAVACLKALPRKCSTHWIKLLHCQTTRVSVALTSTP
jgi:hydroxyacylglutathione hydrolase